MAGTIRELDRVALTRGLPALGLKAGDIGTVVLVHQGGHGFEVEFVAPDGDTRAVTTLMATDVTPVNPPGSQGPQGLPKNSR